MAFAGCPGASNIKGTPVLEVKKCPRCGSEAELFSNEDSTVCENCGQIIYNDEPREVFKHYRELEEMGLSAPQVTLALHKLKQEGFAVDTEVINVEEAAETIGKCFGI